MRDIFVYDIIIIQRGLTRAWEYVILEKIIISLTHLLGKKVLFHFDDVIPERKKKNIGEILTRVDAVITTNELLASWAKEYNKKSHVIPDNINSVRVKQFTLAERRHQTCRSHNYWLDWLKNNLQI